MNVSRHSDERVSCRTRERVMSQICVWHVTHMTEWIVSRFSRHLQWSCYLRCIMNHVSRVNMSRHSYEWVMTHTNESYHTRKCVTSHIWMTCHNFSSLSPVKLAATLCCMWMNPVTTYECVMSLRWTGDVNVSRHTHEWVKSPLPRNLQYDR